MRTYIKSLLLMLSLLAFPAAATAQLSPVTTASISTAGADCSVSTNCAMFGMRDYPAIGIYLNVAASGTFVFEATTGSDTSTATWFAINDDVGGSGSATADGYLTFSNPGYTYIRFRASAISGTATVAASRGFTGLRSTATLSGAAQGDGAIQDGTNSAIEMTVFDFTNSNPAAVHIVDANGDAASIGGGTEYDHSQAITLATANAKASGGRVSAAAPATAGVVDDDFALLWVRNTGEQVVGGGGTAGSPSSNVITVQGVTSMTPLLVGDAAGAFNVIVDSGTITVTDGAGALNTIIDSGTVTTVSTVTLNSDVRQGTAANLNATVVGTGTFATQAAQSGTWTVQPGNTANTTPWLTSISQGGLTATVRDTGASDSLNVVISDGVGGVVTSFGGGTQHAVDTALGATPTGTLAIAIRDDALSTLTPIEGDAIGLRVDSLGALWTTVSGTVNIQGTVASDAATSANPLLAGGRSSTAAPTAVSADGDAVALWLTRNGASNTILRDSTGDSAMSDTLNAVQVSGVSTSATAYLTTRLSDGTNFLTPGTDYTHDAALTPASTAGPMMMGRASATAPTNVGASDDAVMAWFLQNGSQVVNLAAGGTLVTATSSSLNVNCTGGCTSTSIADDSAFTVATTTVVPIGGIFATDSVDAGDTGAIRMSANRNMFINIRDAAGNERGVNVTAGSALTVDGSATTQPVSGTITANAGSGNFGINMVQVSGTNIVAHDATATSVNPLLVGAYASQAAPTDVTADGDSVRLWALRNGSPVVNLAAGGTLITSTSSSLNTAITAAIPAGTNNIGDVDVLSVVPGTGATSLGKAIDSAAGATDTGVAMLAIRDDTLSALTPAETDYVPLRVNSTGALYVTGGGGGTQYNIDDVASATATGTFALVVRKDAAATLAGTDGDVTGLQVDAAGALRVTGGGGGTEYVVNAAAPADPTGATFTMERDDALSALTEVEGDWTNPRASANGALWVAVDGSVAITNASLTTIAGAVSGTEMQVDVLTMPTVTVTATNLDVQIGGSDSLTIGTFPDNEPFNVAQINGVTPLMGAGNTGTGSQRVTIATDQAAMVGLAIYTEDGAETAGGNLAMSGTVRRDTAVSSAGTTGDNATLNTDASGLAWTRHMDPCTALNPTTVPISVAADTAVISAGGASTRTYICGGALVAAAAEIVNIWEGTGSACGTSSAALAGSTTEANGMSLAANGGFIIPKTIRGIGTNVDVCIRLSTTNRVAGWLSYVQIAQ